MNPLSFLIIEDSEADARQLSQLLTGLPLFYQLDWCRTADNVLNRLSTGTHDLIFLDIHMLGETGTELLRNTPRRPPVIVVTAFPEYAEPCYDLDIVDFLVKPLSLCRLQRALNRALTSPVSSVGSGLASSIFLAINRRLERFDFKDIRFIEAKGINANLHDEQSIKTVSNSISWLASQLPPSQFIRVQKSFIINAHYVTAIDARRVWIGEFNITVGKRYRGQLKQFMTIRK